MLQVVTAILGVFATWLADKLPGVEIDVAAVSLWVVGFITTFGGGFVAWALNKLGSRFPWINTVLSWGRSKAPSLYIPKQAESIEATITPPGEQTRVLATTESGVTTNVSA